MSHLLAPATTLKLPILKKNTTSSTYPRRTLVCSQISTKQTRDQSFPQTRRNVAVGLVSAVVGLIDIGRECRDANAAGKRAPPPPKKEKNDPNVSGVLAKYLANKKRKEAMKDAIAKLREKGKPVDEP